MNTTRIAETEEEGSDGWAKLIDKQSKTGSVSLASDGVEVKGLYISSEEYTKLKEYLLSILLESMEGFMKLMRS